MLNAISARPVGRMILKSPFSRRETHSWTMTLKPELSTWLTSVRFNKSLRAR